MIVPSQFPRSGRAKLALVGEAPGADEVLEGRPFVGKSGRLLDGALAAAGIDRADIYLGNVFQEKAESNNVDPWLRDHERLAMAQARLNAEISAVAPTVIIPLGASALLAITGLTEISRVRGSPFISAGPVAPGTKILATFHPAFVLRQYKMFTVLIDDLMRADREADLGPDIVYPHKEFTLEPDLTDIRWWMRGAPTDQRGLPIPTFFQSEVDPSWPQADLISIDIENDIPKADMAAQFPARFEITCISFAPDDEHAICIPFVDQRRPDWSYWRSARDEAAAWRLVKEICEGPAEKLGQNFVHDAWWLLDRRGIRVNNYRHDTRLQHHALLPELPKDLHFLATAYAGQSWKSWGRGKESKRDA